MNKHELAELALDGLKYRIEKIEHQKTILLEMTEPTDHLPVAKPVKIIAPKAPKKKKRNLSEAARARIAQAQVARWQKHRAAKGQ